MISYHTSVATNTGNTFSLSVAQRGNEHFQFSLEFETIQNETKWETVGELDLYQQIGLSYQTKDWGKKKKKKSSERG